MKISLTVSSKMKMYHAETMKEFVVDNDVKREYDEQDEEYKKLCEDYSEIIGFAREKDRDRFDKELMLILSEEIKQKEMEVISALQETVKTCYLKNTNGYISFGGFMINPRWFCVIRVEAFKVNISKH